MSRVASPWTLGIGLLSVLLFGCESTKQENPADAAPDTEQTQDASPEVDSGADASGLPQGIHELKGIEPDLPYDDLMPLKDILGDTPLVGMGESIHTSEGYYKTKHRLFRFLVEEMGFRAFSIESPWDDAKLVGNYVATGEGDALTAVTTGLFSVWASQSMLEMVEWMRAWNVQHPDDPVAFFGFDIQQPWDDGKPLMDFLTQNASDQAANLNAQITRCDGATSTSATDYWSNIQDTNGDGIPEIADEDFQACTAGLDATETYLNDHKSEIIGQTSDEAFELALVHLVGLRAWELQIYYFYSDVIQSYEGRDQGMAYVLLKFRDLYYPGKKIAVWAHDWHLAMHADRIRNCSLGNQGSRSMGTFLKTSVGDAYQPIGLVGYEVSINWPPTYVGPWPWPVPTDPQCVEVMLHGMGKAYLLVDLAFPGAPEPFLAQGVEHMLNHEYFSLMVPADQYRALIFLDQSPAMESLLW